MLFKQDTLEGIAAGTVTLAFRRWRSPRVKQGTALRTAIGLVAVDGVDVVDPARVTASEARRAGWASRDELIESLERFGKGETYRIVLRFAGADPRIRLRAADELGDDEIAEIRRRLDRLDAASRRGPWTKDVLRLIRESPAVRAADLAVSLGRETLDFKRDVRKLKELALTESLEVGYRISPRGRAVLRRLR